MEYKTILIYGEKKIKKKRRKKGGRKRRNVCNRREKH
jgi:hypothetical protein